MPKIVVTGGAGFIGSHLSRRLAELGHNVIVYDDLSNASGLKNLPPKVKLVKGDVLNFSRLKSVTKKAEIVFHLAVKALPMSFTRPDSVFVTNDEGTYMVCRACNTNKVKKLVYVSSSEVYGTAKYVPMDENHPLIPTTIYAASKAAGEMYVRAFHNQHGLPTIILRPFNTYGPFMRKDWYASVIPKFVSRALKGLPPIIYGDGEQTRDFTYVGDIVEGMVQALDNDKAVDETINIARSKEASVNQIARLATEACGELLGRKLELEPVHEAPRTGDVRRHHADITKARNLLGFEPRVDLHLGLKQYVRWFVSSSRKKLD